MTGSMLAFKFLRAGGVGPFSNHRWPLPAGGEPGEWVIAEARDSACASGIHACDVDHLAYWTAPELWIVELSGDVTRSAKKLVAPRGRLIRRVEAWDRARHRAVAEACVFRARDIVNDLLRGSGAVEIVDRLAACSDIAAVGAIAAGAAAGRGLSGEALAIGYLADAAAYTPIDPGAGMFCAAHAALTEEGFARERVWQSRRLAEELDLSAQ